MSKCRLPATDVELELRDAVERGARRRYMSLAGYMRLALLSQLQSDDIPLDQGASVLARPAAASAGPQPAAAAEERATA